MPRWVLISILAVTPLAASHEGLEAQRVGMPQLPDPNSRAAIAVERQIYFYYHRHMEGDLRISPFAGFCNADQGDFCLEGDWESECQLLRCHSEADQARFLERLGRLARQYPDNHFAVGQAVYAAVRFDEFDTALKLVEICEPGGAWWCHLARGYVLHRSRRSAEAREHLERGLEEAPWEIRCRLEDIHFLLPGGERDWYDEVPCQEREEVHRHFWWLADPFLVDPGNDRWAEHVSRRFELLFHEQRLRAVRASGRSLPRVHKRNHERYYVMRGPPDSWIKSTRDEGTRTSFKGAVSHYAPEELSLEGLEGNLRYELKAGELDEGHTRPDGATSQVPAQVVRFREGDSLMVALASDLSELPMWERERRGGERAGEGEGEGEGGVSRDASPFPDLPDTPEILPVGRAHFVASEGPDHVVFLDPVRIRRVLAFAGTLANRAQLVGLEVLTPSGTGRHRRALMPLDTAAQAISDLLLFSPVGPELPQTRSEAVGQMLPSMQVDPRLRLGLYWEAYGVEPEGELSLTIRLNNVGGGLLGRLGRAVGLRDRTRSFSWTELAEESAVPGRAVALQIGGLDEGRYELTLEMVLPDGTRLARTVTMEVAKDG